MPATLYFGPEARVHKPEFRNPAFSVFEVQEDTLNIGIRLDNDGEEVDGVTVNLYALHYSHKTRHLDHSRMTPKELNEQAILAMSSHPLRAWCDHFVPASSKPAWRSDTVLHRLPEGTVGYLLVATVLVACMPKEYEDTRPSENPQIAIWRSEKPGRRC